VNINSKDDEEESCPVFNFGEKCTLCVELGRAANGNHDVEDCWANPYSKRYRKGYYDARLLECLRSGRKVPSLMQVYQEKS
jgi:hypothetical protein